MTDYEFDDEDLRLLAKCREAMAEYDSTGHVKDYLDDSDLVEVVKMLLAVVDDGDEA